jgi:hypothetical protein
MEFVCLFILILFYCGCIVKTVELIQVFTFCIIKFLLNYEIYVRTYVNIRSPISLVFFSHNSVCNNNNGAPNSGVKLGRNPDA